MKVIYQPVKPFFVRQGFGANEACVSPDNKVISCDGNNPPEGYRSLYGEKGHTGLDLHALHGQEVFCAQTGVVTHIDTNPKSGLDVRITSVINGDTYEHVYEHLLGYVHQKGVKVETGQVIGWADNTGYSSGDHLHFEVKKNGVHIDPLPIMESIFAGDILKINNTLKSLFEQVAILADRLAEYLRK